MIQVGMHEAKTRLSELVALIHQGEQVYLTKRGSIVAKLALPEEEDQHKAAKVLRELQELAEQHPPGILDELIAWKSEGRL
ncbi:MAG: type II toxin-antitoxin system Phd/YefM family antitoxin [Caldilineaceae bacterium]